MSAVSPSDPVASRRSAIAQWASTGKRVGYGLYLLAIVLFVAGYVARYTTLITTLITLALVIGSLVLAPAIVFGYGVRAAEREERRAALQARRADDEGAAPGATAPESRGSRH
ncbi:MAG: hypothetical protein R2755_29200 [Acidimicrobiales bacterium]